MKEMLGGCCVCSDERGWTENPLVYCDGQGCTVAVHQACYGIVTVPTGPWYCRKCESQERSARVRCELCPSRDGALKRTNQAGWAHVVCALYIPEVRFGNVTTMEPIILELIPVERFSKTCYICEEQGRGSRANVGACMQCNKTGCRQQFHVTCAQALGLLCEEAGNYLDNVKYCGYCQHHYSKLKKGGNVKTIPPYKPIPADNGSSDSSPEKEAETPIKSSSGKRKSSNSKSTMNSKSKSNASPSLEINGIADDKSGSSGRNTPKDNSTSSSKFTTSNFVETVVTQSESVFGHEGGVTVTTAAIAAVVSTMKTSGTSNAAHKNIGGQGKSNSSTSNKTSSHTSKKRKTGARTPTVIGNDNSNQSASSEASGSVVVAVSSVVQQVVPSNNVQPTITEATSLSTTTEPEKSKKMKVESPIQSLSSTPVSTEATIMPVIMAVTQSQSSIVTQSPTTTTSNSIVVSVPLTATSLANTVQSVVTSAPTMYQQLQQSIITTAANTEPRLSAMANTERFIAEEIPVKRSRSQSSDKQEKSRKPKRGSNSQASLLQSQTTVSLPVASVSSTAVVTTSKRGARNNHQTPPPSATVAPVPSIIQGPTSAAAGHFSSISGLGTLNTMGPIVKESPPSSPGSESMGSNTGKRKRKAAVSTPTPSASTTPTTLTAIKEENNIKLFQNGVSAPHMLGNQLNPTSTMAQKMSDTLSQELEAHSIFTEASNSNTNLVGPQLHSRVIASIRSSQSSAPPTSFSSVFSASGSSANPGIASTSGLLGSGALGSGAIPQTLDQLLERQWEQGSQFLMEQAQHFDIASLLSCLHQLRAENLRLEEHVNNLLQRRDHLLAVNARLAIPLTTQPSSHPVNNIHPTVNPSHPNVSHSEVPPGAPASVPRVNREPRVNNTYMSHSSSSSHPSTLENGLPPDPSPPAAASLAQYQHRGSLVAPQPSPTIRHSPAGGGYLQGQPSNIVSPAPANTSGVVRNSSVTPDPLRGVPRSASQSSSNYMPSIYQPTMSSLTSNQVGAVHNLHSHGPSPTSHGPPGKPS